MRKFSLKVPLAVTVLGAAMAFSVSGEWPWLRLSDVSTTSPILVTSAYRVVSDTLHTGENVSTLLDRQGVTGLNLNALAIALSFDPKRIRAGLIFSVHRDGITNEATHVEFRPNPQQRVQFIRTSGGWTGQAVPVRWTVDTMRVSGEIVSSLYAAFDREVSEATLDLGERRKVADAFADVNQWSVDFTRSQQGDRFSVVIERLTSEDGETKFGRILASALVASGEEYTAISYTSPDDGKTGFYDLKGNALKRAFLVAPLEYRMISSRFSSARFHPVLGLMRRHEGTDYAADRGTPVRATGDGIVAVSGWSGGYGNLIEIRHANGIITRYGHLSRVASRAGARVHQGDVIGYVGSTGLATGAHLHYEFRINGIARDAQRAVPNTGGAPLPARLRPNFLHVADAMSQLLGLSVRGRTSTVAE